MTDQAPHFCTHCGAPLESGAHFCSECGASIAGADGEGPTPAPAAAPVAGAATPPAPQAAAGGTPPPVIPPGAPPGPEQPGGTSGDGGFRVPKWAVVTLAALLVVALIAALVWVLADGDGEAEGEIFLEPAASLGEDPFSDEVLETDPIAATSATTVPATTGGDSRAVSSVQGNAPGLYGGTRDSARCDREAMIVFLEANSAKASAWVQAINSDPTLRWSGGTQVRVDQIGTYIRELTPVTLTRDTRVTNHGFRNGRPTARQSVLQAGSAVLVDRYGVPRARCGCGNPLIPPASVRITPTYVGPRWTGWNPVTVVVVTQVTVEIDVFILVDLLTGERLERPAGTTGSDDIPATTTTTTTVVPPPTQTTPPTRQDPQPRPQPVPGLGTGDVQVTLEWSGDADLDLHVIDPMGTEIYYGNKTSGSGGSLDRDKIPSCGDTGPHIENVFWPTGGAPTGQYQAFVRNLGSCSGSGSFEMTILVNGAYVGGDGGTLAADSESDRVTFGF